MKLLIYLLAGVAVASAYSYEITQFLVNGNNQFTLDLSKEVAKANPGKSYVMSGFSAMSPLAQLGLASTGVSHDEIFKAIGMPNDTITKEVFNFANQEVSAAKGIDLKIANSIFIPKGLELNDEFNTVSKKVFRSEVKQVDFTKKEEAALTINTWVEDHTNKRIKDFVRAQSLSPAIRAILVNAIYFKEGIVHYIREREASDCIVEDGLKPEPQARALIIRGNASSFQYKGNWRYDDKFDPALTEARDFHVTKDETIKIPTMFRHGDYYFAENKELDAKFLRIPYQDEFARFLVVLPNQVDGLATLEEKLKDTSVFLDTAWNLKKTEVELYLPKFKIETSIDLKDVLKKIGVTNIFNPANSGIEKLIKSGEIFISDAFQKVFIEVNEEGAEAAAASGFSGLGGSAQFVPQKQIFKADHPFLFFLMLKDNILFNGAFYGQDE